MKIYRFIGNIFKFVALIIALYVLFMFFSGNNTRRLIQGTWIGVECSTEFTFANNYYSINGVGMGRFSIARGRIIFSNEESYPIMIGRRQIYILIDGKHYIRMSESD